MNGCVTTLAKRGGGPTTFSLHGFDAEPGEALECRYPAGSFHVTRHNHNIFAALFSPDGNLFVTGDYGGAVRLWPALTFETIDGGRR